MRTKAGLLLEKLLNQLPNSYRDLFCWNGEPGINCSSCTVSCQCQCHERFEEMAQLPHIKLWLLALEAKELIEPSPIEQEYPHYPFCNGSRKFPAGVKGHSCSCLRLPLAAFSEVEECEVSGEEFEEYSESFAEFAVDGFYDISRDTDGTPHCVRAIRLSSLNRLLADRSIKHAATVDGYGPSRVEAVLPKILTKKE